MKPFAAITAVGGWVPEYRLTNAELETMMDTTDEWITTRTGIKERRILKGDGQGSSVLAEHAVRDLFTRHNINPAEIDLIIYCSVTPDMIFPASANVLSERVGATNAFGFDMNAACSGFLFGLVTGAKYIESETFKKVLVVGADKMSAIVDYEDRATCVLFGDGGGAVLLEPSYDGFGIRDHILKSDGSGRPYLFQKAGGSMYPPSHETVAKREHYVIQEGKTVFKFAVVKMADVAEEIMKRNNLTAEDIAYLVPHQANKRIIDATAERMGIGMDKVMLNIQRYGNTTNGTIPLCLWEWENKLHKGDNLVLAAFGGGFTWGAVWVKWAYN
jgi:3-oxoacyl-[acyl-carrier-protein] synthase-3